MVSLSFIYYVVNDCFIAWSLKGKILLTLLLCDFLLWILLCFRSPHQCMYESGNEITFLFFFIDDICFMGEDGCDFKYF